MGTKQISKLAALLGMGGANGGIPLAAIAGLFTWGNVPLIALVFIAGPGAITLALFLSGNVQERMFIALVSGIIATGVIMFAAGFGPNLLGFVNLNVLRIAGGVSMGVIALMVVGLKIPDNLPLGIMLVGILLAGVLK